MRSRLLLISLILITAFNLSGQRSVRDYMIAAGSVADSNINYLFKIPENEDFDFFVGALPGPVNYPSDVLDNNLFYVSNDSLFSRYSFDFENPQGNKYRVVFSNNQGLDTVLINVLDVLGKWDSNGVADADIAAYYPQVNIGDYIIWNYTSSYDIDLSLNSWIPGSKVLIHGKSYHSLKLDLSAISNTSTAQRMIITNFLGQVEVRDGLELENPNWTRITGKYNVNLKTGHRYFTGCDQGSSSTDFTFSHGQWGFYINNQWQSDISGNGLLIETDNTGVEIDYMEIANGFKNGIEVGWTNNYSIGEHHYIHHNFIHDIGGEGIMFGLPGGYPQQVFSDALIENNCILRTGSEGIQATWITMGSIIRNNFIHAAIDWKDPYARWQDGVLQVGFLGNQIQVENNILMGGGTVVSDIKLLNNAPGLTYVSDTFHYNNNLLYCNRSNTALYQHTNGHNLVDMSFNANYIARLGYDLDEVYQNGDSTNNTVFGINSKQGDNILTNNVYDNSVENISGGTANTIESNNQLQFLPFPKFENYLNKPDGFNYLRLHRYTDQIGSSAAFPGGGTNKGSAPSWEVGDIVQVWNAQGETRFYECIQAQTSGTVAPPQDDTDNGHWRLMTWAKPNGRTSYYPPDDVRLVSGSFFDQFGMGLQDVLPGSSPNNPGNILPSLSLSGISNGDTLNKATLHQLTANAFDQDGHVDSVLFLINGTIVLADSIAPYNFSLSADSTGSYTLSVIAIDDVGDSTSLIVNYTVIDDHFFRVLHYCETSGTDHGTKSASYNLLMDLGQQYGFEVDNDTTGTKFDSLATLSDYDVVIFSNTTGNQLLDSNQRSNFESYMNTGGSFIGIHAAVEAYRHSTANGSNTGSWDWFAEMLGASNQESPSGTNASHAGVLDHLVSHPSLDNLPNPWNETDEYYYWENGYYNSNNITLLQVQTTGAQSYDQRRPVAWYKYLNTGGRSFYTGLGHDSSDFAMNTNFRNHIRDAVLWSVTNIVPLVSFTAPAPNDTIILNDNLIVSATALDADGTVDSVRFEFDGQSITLFSAPWQTSFTASNKGNFVLKATAFDDLGDYGVATPQTLYVIDTAASCFDGIMNQDETGIDCGGVCAPCPTGNQSELKKLLTYFETAYHADSTYSDLFGNNLAMDGSEVGYLKDIIGTYHAKWSGGFITLRYPHKPYLRKRIDGTYIDITNALNREWTTKVNPRVAPPMHTFYVVRPTEHFRYYEGYNIHGPVIRNKGNALYSLKWTNETKFSGGGILEPNKMTIVEIQITGAGMGKMWINGVPYNNGQSVQVGNGLKDLWGYGTNSHVAGHHFFFEGTKFNILTSNQRDSVYKHLNNMYDIGGRPPHPLIENMNTTFNAITNVFSVQQNIVLYNNIPIDTIMYQWYMEGPNIGAGNRLDRIIAIPGATDATLDRDDYPQSQFFKGTGKKTGKSVYRSTKLIDVAGNESWWIEGDHTYDNVD